MNAYLENITPWKFFSTKLLSDIKQLLPYLLYLFESTVYAKYLGHVHIYFFLPKQFEVFAPGELEVL